MRRRNRFTGKDASISRLVGKTFIVIGAGGAGKALAYGARENGAKVVIANRSYGSFLPLTSFYSQVLRFCMYGNAVESYNNTFCFYLTLCSPREPDALCCCNN
ncbi:hypothetical protein BHM03_00043074 [Ensete ventricosum]|nr:hypothetical protein BHM03_00043074 [Ensete ventricosum]